jgi:Zn-dependent M28 family amino/carboxypeptidase
VLGPLSTARLRRLALAVAACLPLAAGCEPAPSVAPSSLPPTQVATAGQGTSQPGASPAADLPFADALRDAVDADRIFDDLEQLQSITDAHGGVRPGGSDGHAAAADFVADQLRAMGYRVDMQRIDLPAFAQTGPSTLEIRGAGARSFDDLRDFKAMLFSPSADITAALYPLGFNPGAAPGDSAGLGCRAADWQGVPAGVIVLVQPGNCRRHDVVVHAAAAGALGIITAYPAWSRDRVLRPTLINPADITIPAIGTTEEVGIALNDAASSGASVHIVVEATTETRSSVNVIAETPFGDPTHVVMVGGHLDSVVDGPGMNDDGSGTMTALGIARALASVTGMAGGTASSRPQPTRTVRFAFWTGEEIGLFGSRAYVEALDDPRNIEAYLNLDMLGSPNGGRMVYDGSFTSRPRESGAIGAAFSRALDDMGLVWQTASLGGSSDHASFDAAGIATGGLFAGANELKTQAQADIFGGSANAPGDPCMHLACDRTDQLDRSLLAELARVGAWTLGALASGEIDTTAR